MSAPAPTRIVTATIITTIAGAAPLLGLLGAIAYFDLAEGMDGGAAAGGALIAYALALIPLYAMIVFPLRAMRLKRRGLYSSDSFRRYQTLLLALFCFVAGLLTTIVAGSGSVSETLMFALTVTPILFILLFPACVVLVLLWLRLAK